MNSATFNDDWVGGYESEYWTGPGDVQVNLINRVDYKIRPIWNVMVTIPGSEEPEKV